MSFIRISNEVSILTKDKKYNIIKRERLILIVNFVQIMSKKRTRVISTLINKRNNFVILHYFKLVEMSI